MKKTLITLAFLAAVPVLSGCSLQTSVSQPTRAQLVAKATVLKTVDGGLEWEPKIKVSDQKDISSLNVLTVAMDPFDSETVYLGTEKNGIFVSRDGAETWSQIKFPEKVYGLIPDHGTRDMLYASGVFGGRAKIFKKIGEDEWKEIYTEPSKDSVISAMAMDKNNANVIYAGTSQGMIFKTTDAGTSWHNLYMAGAPVTSIAFDSADTSVVYFGVFQRDLLKTTNGGETIERITSNISSSSNSQSVFSVVADPGAPGTVYIGLAKGISKSTDGGKTWSNLNILESSKMFPIRAMAINPSNSSEMIYVSGKAVSIDSGNQWSTFQLDTGKDVSSVVYNRSNPAIIYAGFRSF